MPIVQPPKADLQAYFKGASMPLGLCNACCVEFRQAEANGFPDGVPPVNAAILTVGLPQQYGPMAAVVPVGTCAGHFAVVRNSALQGPNGPMPGRLIR